MRQLFIFIIKHNFTFLFLFLEAISFFLIINNNDFQKEVFISSSNKVIAKIYFLENSLLKYLSLNKQNQKLIEENAILKSKQVHSFLKVFGQNVSINDTIYFQQYLYLGANVINQSVNKRNNYITIDKGILNNVKAGMGVISKDGVVGIVKKSSKHFATIMSILHKDIKISALIKKNGYFGTVFWDGIDYRYGILSDIPSHVVVEKGDTVVTSGFSSIFPKGIPIATIMKVENSNIDNFLTIRIKFTQDYKKLYYVYVVKNLLKLEKENLEKNNND